MTDLTRTALELYNAKMKAVAVPQLDTEIDEIKAYAIQSKQLELHREAKDPEVGLKLGFTSLEKMKQMGVDSIIVGFLTESMKIDASVPLSLDGYIHPRIEPELVFRVARDVNYEKATSPEELADLIRGAVDGVAAGLEIIDSRFMNFKFSLSDVVADNTSAAGFVVGEWQEYPRPLQGLATSFRVDAEIVHEATTDAILGDPDRAFEELAKMMLEYGLHLRAGEIILAGSITPAEPLQSGSEISVSIYELPELSIRTRAVDTSTENR